MFYDQKSLYLRRCCWRYPRPRTERELAWKRDGKEREERSTGRRWPVMYLALSRAMPPHHGPHRVVQRHQRHSWVRFFIALSRYHACTYSVYRPDRSFVIVVDVFVAVYVARKRRDRNGWSRVSRRVWQWLEREIGWSDTRKSEYSRNSFDPWRLYLREGHCRGIIPVFLSRFRYFFIREEKKFERYTVVQRPDIFYSIE